MAPGKHVLPIVTRNEGKHRILYRTFCFLPRNLNVSRIFLIALFFSFLFVFVYWLSRLISRNKHQKWKWKCLFAFMQSPAECWMSPATWNSQVLLFCLQTCLTTFQFKFHISAKYNANREASIDLRLTHANFSQESLFQLSVSSREATEQKRFNKFLNQHQRIVPSICMQRKLTIVAMHNRKPRRKWHLQHCTFSRHLATFPAHEHSRSNTRVANNNVLGFVKSASSCIWC